MRYKFLFYCCLFCFASNQFFCIDRETSVGTGKLLPDKVLMSDGDDQTGIVGTQAFNELSVRVIDAANQPVAKVKVEFLVQFGSVFPTDTIVTTNLDGYAKTKVTYGLIADTIEIDAIVLGIKGSPVHFTLQSFPADVNLLKAVSDTVIIDQAGSTLKVTVRASDIYNNPVGNAIIKFDAKLHKGSVANANVVTDSTGKASSLWTLDTLVGTCTLEASIATRIMEPVIFSAKIIPGNAAKLIALSGDKQFGFIDTELPFPLVIALQDKYGNYLPTPSVKFSNPRRRGGITFKNPYDDYYVFPARSQVTLILGSYAGTNIVVASNPPASPVQFGFNAYYPVFLFDPTSSSGVVNLQWTANINQNFSCYQVFRSTTPGVPSSNTLLATISDQAVTQLSDSTVVAGAKYFYSLNMVFLNGQSFFSNEVEITP